MKRLSGRLFWSAAVAKLPNTLVWLRVWLVIRIPNAIRTAWRAHSVCITMQLGDAAVVYRRRADQTFGPTAATIRSRLLCSFLLDSTSFNLSKWCLTALSRRRRAGQLAATRCCLNTVSSRRCLADTLSARSFQNGLKTIDTRWLIVNIKRIHQRASSLSYIFKYLKFLVYTALQAPCSKLQTVRRYTMSRTPL